jgi:hypothetical protein
MSSRAALQMIAQGQETLARGLRMLADAPDPEEWIDQTRSPLGRRQHCTLARRGVLTGARKIGGRWLVKRKNLDAFIDAQQGGDASVSEERAQVLAFKARSRKRPAARGGAR